MDLSKPADAVKARQKVQCSTEDGKPAVYWWKGGVYSRVPGENELLDPAKTGSDDATVSWARISKWLPWMKMGDRPGVVVFHTAGLRVNGWDDVPDIIRNEVKTNWPLWQEAPPIDDPTSEYDQLGSVQTLDGSEEQETVSNSINPQNKRSAKNYSF